MLLWLVSTHWKWVMYGWLGDPGCMGWERTRKSWWCRFSMPVGHPPSFPTSLPAAAPCLLLHPARPSPSSTSCTIPEYKKIVNNDKRMVTKTVCPKAVHICLQKGTRAIRRQSFAHQVCVFKGRGVVCIQMPFCKLETTLRDWFNGFSLLPTYLDGTKFA